MARTAGRPDSTVTRRRSRQAPIKSRPVAGACKRPMRQIAAQTPPSVGIRVITGRSHPIKKTATDILTVGYQRARRRHQLLARRARQAPTKLEGAGHPATPSGPPFDQHPPGSRPQPLHRKRGSAGIPSTAGLAPKGRLTYLEHCGKCATTNSRRTMSGSLKTPT